MVDETTTQLSHNVPFYVVFAVPYGWLFTMKMKHNYEMLITSVLSNKSKLQTESVSCKRANVSIFTDSLRL